MIPLTFAAEMAARLSVDDAIRQPCASPGPTEVVVCGSRNGKDSPYRLPKVPEKYQRAPLRAERQIAPGVNANAHVQSVELLQGARSDRLMLSIKVGF